MARVLGPEAYYSGQSPLQARALGTQIGTMERQAADQEAQMQGRMAAGGFADPQSYYEATERGRIQQAEQDAKIKGMETVADIMDGANELLTMGYDADVPEYLQGAWDNIPFMQSLFPEGAPTLEKKGNRITSKPWVAGEDFPGRVLDENKEWGDAGTKTGKSYITVTEGEDTWFERVPGTQELKAKGRKDKAGGATSALNWDKAVNNILMKTQGTTTASGIVISPERQIETEIATRLLNDYRRHDANTAVSKALNEARSIERQIPTYTTINDDGDPVENKKQIARMGKNKKTGKRVVQFTDGTTLEIN